mgnify:CR=1 FL=1
MTKSTIFKTKFKQNFKTSQYLTIELINIIKILMNQFIKVYSIQILNNNIYNEQL